MNTMEKKQFYTDKGTIIYFTNTSPSSRLTLVFLPGLTADHRLFDKQIEHFEGVVNVMTWDAPGHAESRPFDLDFDLKDKAKWLKEILEVEKIENPVIVGQSMGGYVGQAFLEMYPNELVGFVSIDSAPLQRKYMKNWEIASLKHTKGMYSMYPWKSLLKAGSEGVATTEYGIGLMREMMEEYDHKYYSALAGHGFGMLAKAVEADLPYKITCPTILICGEEDKAGYTKKYNKMWHENTGTPIYWIEGAGHNANTDKPEEINMIIENFIERKVPE